MRNILLLTDFSENAQNAIDYAFQLFKGNVVTFSLLYIHKINSYTTDDLILSSATSSIYSSIIKNHKTELKNLINSYSEIYKNEKYQFNSFCDYSTFISAVKKSIELNKIDLIVMGTSGASNANKFIFGSNTINVIRNIETPVLAIPKGSIFKIPKKALFITENDDIFDESSLTPLMDILKMYNSKLEILSFEDTNFAKKDKMILFFSDIEHHFYTVKESHIDVVINTVIQINKIDFIAKIINRKSFLNRLIHSATTLKITYYSRIPFLIMHS